MSMYLAIGIRTLDDCAHAMDVKALLWSSFFEREENLALLAGRTEDIARCRRVRDAFREAEDAFRRALADLESERGPQGGA